MASAASDADRLCSPSGLLSERDRRETDALAGLLSEGASAVVKVDASGLLSEGEDADTDPPVDVDPPLWPGGEPGGGAGGADIPGDQGGGDQQLDLGGRVRHAPKTNEAGGRKTLRPSSPASAVESVVRVIPLVA